MSGRLDDLRWLLRFAALEFWRLTPEETFNVAREVNAFLRRSTGRTPSGSLMAIEQRAARLDPTDTSRLPAALYHRAIDVMRPLQSALQAGLGQIQAGRSWDLPAMKSSLIPVNKVLARRLLGSPTHRFITASADALRATWSSIRECASPTCAILFVPDDPRQKYHDLECGRKARWAKFKPTRKKPSAKKTKRVRRGR